MKPNPVRLFLPSPRRAGILTAIVVTILLVLTSFPREERIVRQIENFDTSIATDAQALLERYAHTGPWWSPQRYAYRAIEAEADAAARILTMTYERDLTGLVWLLLLDIGLGILYGIVIGLIVSVLRTTGLQSRHQGSSPRPSR